VRRPVTLVTSLVFDGSIVSREISTAAH
jgi:hypothetical protein